jgi:hypothetical protein
VVAAGGQRMGLVMPHVGREARPGECVYMRVKIVGVGCVGAASPQAIKPGCNHLVQVLHSLFVQE